MTRNRLISQLGCVVGLALGVTSCGEYVRNQGRAPAQVVIQSLTAVSGAESGGTASGTLRSDVVTLVKRTVNGTETLVPTIFDDSGQVTMALILKDPGQTGSPSTPSELNQVTFTRYRVTYRRADGRNTPGIDVPYPFDSAATFTVPATGSATVGFTIVRHNAKEESPLAALSNNQAIISTLTDVQFFGRDQAGNEVTATGTIGIFFGNFGDPL